MVRESSRNGRGHVYNEYDYNDRFRFNTRLRDSRADSWRMSCPDVPSFLITDAAETAFGNAVRLYDPTKSTFGTYTYKALNTNISRVVRKYRKRADKMSGVADIMGSIFSARSDSDREEDLEFARYVLSFAEKPGLLTDRESDILRFYFGFNLGASYPMTSIGRLNGVSDVAIQHSKRSLLIKLLGAARDDSNDPEMRAYVTRALNRLADSRSRSGTKRAS